MKRFAFLLIGTFAFVLLSSTINSVKAQFTCPQLTEVTFLNANTVEVTLNVTDGILFFLEGVQVFPNGNNQIVASFAIEDIVQPLSQQLSITVQAFNESFEACGNTYSFADNVILTTDDFDVVQADCDGLCTGQICLNSGNGSGDTFVINGTSSTGNCANSLCEGNYTVTPDSQVFSGVTFNYYQMDIEIFGSVQVDLVLLGTQVVPVISGGSGDYTWQIGVNPPGQSADYEGPGCYSITVEDNLNPGCDISTSVYLNEGCYGDFDGDGLVITSDLLALLNVLGLPDEGLGEFDQNCDGLVNVSDLLAVLNVFGTSCP